MEDITKFLAFEVKKEMADRYFGFRKRIEDDTQAYVAKLTALSKDLENKIGRDLTRIYILLQKEVLIKKFLQIVGLPTDFYYDRYAATSPTIRRKVFAGLGCHGLTRKGRYKKTFLQVCQSLVANVHNYVKVLKELTEDQTVISEQIKMFYRKNDIDSMLGFIRQLDGPDASTIGLMQGGPEILANQQLSASLRIRPPIAPTELIPTIPELPALGQIGSQLDDLMDEAYEIPRNWRLRDITKA